MFAQQLFQEICIPRPAAPRQLSLFGDDSGQNDHPAFYGRLRRPVIPPGTALFDFALAEVEEGSLLMRDKEDGWRMILSLEGCGSYSSGAQQFSLPGESGILQRADRPMACTPQQAPWQVAYLRFDGDALALVKGRLKKTRPNLFHFGSLGHFEAAASDVLDACQTRANQRSAAVRDALQRLCSLLLEEDHFPEAVTKAQRYMLEHLTQDLTAAQLAQAAGISQRHLTRLFDEYTGLSPMNWLTQARLDRARAYLATEMPLTQVAQAAGFPSEKAFRTDFRNRWHCSPSQYRSRLNQQAQRDEKNV